MAREREVRVTVLGDSSSGQRALAQLDNQATKTGNHFDGLGSKMMSFGKVAALGLAGAAVGVGAFLKSSVEAAEESRKVMAQTDAVIKSTGGVARVTAKDVDTLADSLSAMSGVDDEVIASGQNLLLTFTNIRNEVGQGNDIFDQGTKAALNMSVALGTDMNSAAMLVGKALNDPIKGMTALTRSGIQFTDQQKEQVKAMVAAGNTLAAQKIILKELETQFGGSAAAAASPMERLKVVVGNLQEELGARFLPVIAKVATFLANNLPAALDRVGAVIGPIISKIREFADAIVGGFQNADAGIGPSVSKMEGFFLKLGAAARAVVDWFVANWPQIKATVSEVLETVGAVISGFVDVVTTIWQNFGSQITAVVSAAWEAVKSTIQAALETIQGIVKVVTGIIHGDWSQVWEGIKQILGAAWDFIVARVQLGIDLAREILSVGWEIVKGIFTGAWDGLKGIVREGIAWIVDKFLAFVETFTSGAAKLFGWVPGVGPKIREAAEAVEEFRDRTNAALRGTDSEKTINVYHNTYHRDYYDTVRGQDPYAGNMHTGGIVPGSGDVPMILKGGEGVFTPEQMAVLGASMGRGSGGLDAKALEAALTAALAPLVARLGQAGMTIHMHERADPMHIMREAAWAMG